MHMLTTAGVADIPQSYISLGYTQPNQTARRYTCKDAEFPRIDISLPQRLGSALKSTLDASFGNQSAPIDDPLEDLVAISRFKIPELELNNRPIKDVLNSRPLVGSTAAQPTPKKRVLDDITAATPTASAMKRRKANVDLDLANMSCDVSIDGFIGTDKILGMVDASLLETPDRNVDIVAKVQNNAPGPSPRNGQPKYLYDDNGLESTQQTIHTSNPFRAGAMPPPNWRDFIKRR